jgi:hypothetical protein
MAWRIHDNVVRGEIDNRERGIVRGKIWLKGIAEPITLELKGNACADLAGCLLTFENPAETFSVRSDARLAPLQCGTVGDLTASRKVRVFDMPTEEAYMRKKKKLPVPEHMANCVYLEWFSELNGRVVIESTDYKVLISPPAWRLTAEEEENRQKEAASGFSGFMQQLSEALEAQKHEPSEEKEWDEFDYEKFMRESDARTDKYGELLDKYMDHPDRDRIIAKEMGWGWLEEALDEQKEPEEESKAEEQFAPDADGEFEGNVEEGFEFPDDLPDLQPDPATEGVDWVRDKHGHTSHPLALRALDRSVALWRKCDELGLRKTEDEDICDLISEYQITSAKLAGALNGLAYGRDLREGAFIVAYLKRALGHLHAAQGALEKVTPKKVLPEDTVETVRKELFEIREEILRLMDEFRGKS